MKDEKLLELSLKEPDFLCESGSRLYGMATPTSDHDLRGFVFPSFSYLIKVKKFKCKEFDEDTKIYSTDAFLKLVLKGDPQTSELFYAPVSHHKKVSSFGKAIMSLKEDIISNAIYGRIMGYSRGEWRKAMAVKIISKKNNKTKKGIIDDIRNHWKLNKKKMDGIIKILDSTDEKKVVSSFSGLGTKRKKAVEKFGFCPKSAAHSIRLVEQVTELMSTGKMSFPRPNAKMLLDIRNGKYSKKELENIHDDVVAKAETTREKSVLIDKPNTKKVWKVYQDMVKKIISRMDLNKN